MGESYVNQKPTKEDATQIVDQLSEAIEKDAWDKAERHVVELQSFVRQQQKSADLPTGGEQ